MGPGAVGLAFSFLAANRMDELGPAGARMVSTLDGVRQATVSLQALNTLQAGIADLTTATLEYVERTSPPSGTLVVRCRRRRDG